MKKRTFLIALPAIVLVLSAGIRPAMSYFSDYTTATGGVKVTVTEGPEATEEEKDMVKTLVISNKEDADPIFVRAKVIYSSSKATVEVTPDSGAKWTDAKLASDGYYYYTELLEGGKQTEPLQVKITVTRQLDEEGNPIEPMEGDEFNVVVVYESVLARYNDAGTDYVTWDAADWSIPLDVVTDKP